MFDESLMNDHEATREARLVALASYLASAEISGKSGPLGRSGESNNHIHTCYSFSPYTPTAAAFAAWRAGLSVAGSVDHDSLAGAPEMRKACALLGLGSVTGFELRVFLYDAEKRARGGSATPLANLKINNPDSRGIIYMTVQGVPHTASAAVEEFLRPVREARRARTEAMCLKASAFLESAGARPLDFGKDVVGRSRYGEGGTITERHLLAAMADSLITAFGTGPGLATALEARMGMKLSGAARMAIIDPANPYLDYDLLGLLKAEFLPAIFIQPSSECLDAAGVVKFALSLGAIPAYAYLGDIIDSPTGDKKSEKFEDEFLPELFDELEAVGFPAVTYMPPRNTLAQLARVGELCRSHGFMEISGVDINQPRQSFNCPELLRPEFSHLDESTWALVAHEALAGADISYGFFSRDNPFAKDASGAALGLHARLALYAKAGRDFVALRNEGGGEVGAIRTIADKILKGRYG